jgi:hypothetical protein
LKGKEEKNYNATEGNLAPYKMVTARKRTNFE